MAEIRTVTTLRHKRDEIERSIANYEKRLAQAQADLAHINAAISIFEASRRGVSAPSFCTNSARDVMRGEGELGADHPGVLHHPLDLLVELVAVGDDEDAGLGIVLHDPLGEQYHHDAFAAALGVPDNAALALGDALLRSLHAEELMRPRHLIF